MSSASVPHPRGRHPRRAPRNPSRARSDGGSGTVPEATLERTWRDEPTLFGFLRVNDHKRLGRRFVITAFGFFVAAGLLAAVIRLQLPFPEHPLIGPDL